MIGVYSSCLCHVFVGGLYTLSEHTSKQNVFTISPWLYIFEVVTSDKSFK